MWAVTTLFLDESGCPEVASPGDSDHVSRPVAGMSRDHLVLMVGSPTGNQASVASRLLKGHELNKLQGRPRAVVVGAGVVGLSQVCKSRKGMGVLAFDYGH
jgi:hypothetical protein